tara:strand:- start:820 stop:1434 length:615 start_codon:yes stop_codon:yes gene_type:complete
MKKILLLTLITFSTFTYSQFENRNRNVDVAPPKTKTILPLVTPVNPNAFTIKKEEKKDLPKGMMNKSNEYFLNPGDSYVKRLNKEKEKNPNNYLGDAYLGDVATVSDAANIVCRDFEYVDGDRVRIMVNDEIVVQNLTLDSRFRGINLKLGEGFNKIDFIALNQGDSGPNTAELRIYDDNKKLISSNQWNLATGAKATLIIVKK